MKVLQEELRGRLQPEALPDKRPCGKLQPNLRSDSLALSGVHHLGDRLFGRLCRVQGGCRLGIYFRGGLHLVLGEAGFTLPIRAQLGCG